MTRAAALSAGLLLTVSSALAGETARSPDADLAPCPGLCLNASRFAVTVDWTNPRNGTNGTGHALPLTGDTGSFWFFDPRNVELNVKVLDGRAVNGHFWVFYASLSDVEFTITVTDTETGAVKTFHNPPYTLASRADITAF